MAVNIPTRRLGGIDFDATVLALGCWAFGGAAWGGQEDADSLAAMQAAAEAGINHFDTAQGYGDGRSERLVGDFLQGRRDVFVATKFFVDEPTTAAALAAVETSRERLRMDCIHLFYIHWPRTGVDLRPVMEGLEQARAAGKIAGIGVSNFSPEQMEQVMQVGRIDAHQFCYNMYWRFAEREVIPFCRQHQIGTVTYSSIAQGILTGKFGPQPSFPEGDHRPGTVLFSPEVYPHLYAATEELKALAAETGRDLVQLVIRWTAEQPGIDSVLVGARNAAQVRDNAGAFDGEVPAEVLARMTAISDEAMSHVPDVGNIFRFYP
ncbi:MAG: aldo/keto reductase [Armatimonadetes bacterium]|jgi:myo-inositol catabolism protein IolS|nr:aldo/keto reductase [Armatimonadota bacterium]